MIAGLGEPENKRARRNIGFSVLDGLVDYFNLLEAAERPSEKYEFGRVEARDEAGAPLELVLVKHMNPMMSAGAPIAAAAANFKVSADRVLLVHEEMDLAFGDARLKRGGTAGNHRGVRDVIGALGTPDFHRLRVGVGKPAGESPVDYLAAPFSREERAGLGDYLDECMDHCQEWLFRI